LKTVRSGEEKDKNGVFGVDEERQEAA